MSKLWIVILVLLVVLTVVQGNYGTNIDPISPEFKEILKYVVTGAIVAFIGYLVMTRR